MLMKHEPNLKTIQRVVKGVRTRCWLCLAMGNSTLRTRNHVKPVVSTYAKKNDKGKNGICTKDENGQLRVHRVQLGNNTLEDYKNAIKR